MPLIGPFKPDGKKPPWPVLLPSVAMAMICGVTSTGLSIVLRQNRPSR